MRFEHELSIARDLAWQAGQHALGYMRKGLSVEEQEDKSDGSPVTIADKECEQLFTAGLQAAFPGDGLLGEEGADVAATNGRRWIVDPIDGTRDFVRRNRLWCNLIALEVNGVVELGVCTFPAMSEVYWAVRGGGAWRSAQGETTWLKCSNITKLSRAVVCVNSLERALVSPCAEKLLSFLGRAWTVRSLGGALDAMFVCSGHAEIWIEPRAKPWDLAVMQVVSQEAGLRFFDYNGADTIYGGSAMLCVPDLEGEVRAFLGLG